MRIGKWGFEEGKIGKDKLFTWTHSNHPDYSLSVMKASIKVTHTNQGVTVTYMTKGTKNYNKYLGWFIRFRNKGEFTSFLQGTISEWDYKKGRYVSRSGHGPHTQQDALNLARHTLRDKGFNSRIKPKNYDFTIPGWDYSKGTFHHIWTNKSNGRHRLILGSFFGQSWKLDYHIGYADEKLSKRVIFENIPGLQSAISKTKGYASKLKIQKGGIEKAFSKGGLFDEIAKAVKSVPDKRLSSITKLMKEGTISTSDAVKLITDKRKKHGKR